MSIPQLLILLGTLCTAFVEQDNNYKPYGNYDLRNALRSSKSVDGKDEYRVDKKLTGQVLDDLFVHANDYPTKFRSKEENARAERDAKALTAIFEKLTAKEDADTQLLLTAAILSGFAHNLDIEGAAENAVNYYERILKREPNHPKANYNYGRFLASASKIRESLPYLEKALGLGVEDARYTLGLAYFHLGDTNKALDYLTTYSKHKPNDKEVKRLISDLTAGKLKTRTEGPVKQ